MGDPISFYINLLTFHVIFLFTYCTRNSVPNRLKITTIKIKISTLKTAIIFINFA